MRAPLFVILPALLGCSVVEAPLLLARPPARDPYAPSPLGSFPPVVRVHAPRVPEWSEQRHRDEVAALSTVVQTSLPAAPETTLLTGPETATELVAAYLSDRARFRGARIALVARRARVAADAWSFEALVPDGGALWTIVAREDADALVAGATWRQALVVEDAEEGEASVIDQTSYLTGCEAIPGLDGARVSFDPIIETCETGDQVTARAWLSDGGRALRLAWRHASARVDDAPTEVAVRSASGHTRLTVEVPRVTRDEVQGLFVLRDDEALVLVQAPPGRDDLLVTVVLWTRV